MPAGSQTRVLVVDDEELVRRELDDLLKSWGLEVKTAPGGEEAVAQLASFKPDLVLLDLIMPQMDGFAVLDEIRKRRSLSNLPVVVLTARGDLEGKIRSMECGADDFVTKPFDSADLKRRLESTLLIARYRRTRTLTDSQLIPLRVVDAITLLGTYAQLKTCVDEEIRRARRHDRSMGILVFGVEDYAGFRHRLGSAKCDEFLATMVDKVSSEMMRAGDRLFRLDDEFVLLLAETNSVGCRIAAGRLKQVLDPLKPEVGKKSDRFLFQIGGASFPQEGISCTEDLLREASRVYRSVRDSDGEIFEL